MFNRTNNDIRTMLILPVSLMFVYCLGVGDSPNVSLKSDGGGRHKCYMRC